MNSVSGSHGLWMLSCLTALCGSLGIALIVAAFRMRAKYREAQDWPFTPGKIIRSSVISRANLDSHGKNVYYHCDLLYEYSVDGENYDGTRIAIGGAMADKKSAYADRENYRPGAKATVYYNPAKPKDAVLERDHPPRAFGFLLFGGGLFFLITWLFSLALRSSAKGG